MSSGSDATNALLVARVWAPIRDELARHQDSAPPHHDGSVVNPVCGAVYGPDTACAALVFATEFRRTSDERWRVRATRALDAVAAFDVFSGVAEPRWDRFGWHDVAGSLFATTTLLDALWATEALLAVSPRSANSERLMSYINACHIRDGRYAEHSTGASTIRRPDQSATALALFLLSSIATWSGVAGPAVAQRRRAAVACLAKGQRWDGLWSNTSPTAIQRTVAHNKARVDIARRLPLLRRYLIGAGESSILRGDIFRHCVTLYYATKSARLGDAPELLAQSISRGWQFVNERLQTDQDGSATLDFGWEAPPREFSYVSHGDTASYFMLVATLPLLAELGVVSATQASDVSGAILKHLAGHVVSPKNAPTTVKAYECDDDTLMYMLPRVGESSAWKGALLAEGVSSLIWGRRAGQISLRGAA